LLARKNAYGTHPYAIDSEGTPAVVSAATAKELRALHAATVSRSRLLLVIVGNVTREEVEKQLRPAIKDLSQGNYEAIVLPPMPGAGRASTKLVARDLPTVYVLGLFPAPGMGTADEAATRIGLSVLNHRLFEEIRTKRNLSYAVFSGLRSFASGAGQLYVTTPDPNAAVRVMYDEVERIRTTPIPETKLRDSIGEFSTGELTGQEGSDDIAATLGAWQVATGSWSHFDAFLAKVDSLTPERVRAAMDRYLHHVSFALLGNVDGVDTKLFESF
jgi:zinc protease